MPTSTGKQYQCTMHNKRRREEGGAKKEKNGSARTTEEGAEKNARRATRLEARISRETRIEGAGRMRLGEESGVDKYLFRIDGA